MSIFHGSSFFFPYHLDNQPVCKSFPANPALREKCATASVLLRKAKGCLENHWYCWLVSGEGRSLVHTLKTDQVLSAVAVSWLTKMCVYIYIYVCQHHLLNSWESQWQPQSKRHVEKCKVLVLCAPCWAGGKGVWRTVSGWYDNNMAVAWYKLGRAPSIGAVEQSCIFGLPAWAWGWGHGWYVGHCLPPSWTL